MNRSASIPQWLNICLWIVIALVYSLIPALAGARTLSLATSTPTRAPLSGIAAFDYSPITSLKANPTINGTASLLTGPLYFKVVDASGAVVFQDTSVMLTQGHFAETIFPPIDNGSYKLSIGVGTHELATTTLTIGLHTMLTIEPDQSLATYDVIDGHLMRFMLRAQGKSSVGINQFTFKVTSGNANVDSLQLFGYTDESFTKSIMPDESPLNSELASISPTTSTLSLVPDAPVELLSGHTYYFDLVGAVTPLDTQYYVDTVLMGDTNPHFSVFALASTSNFVWSPNTHGTSSLEDLDWINSSVVSGLPKNGLETVRTNPPPTDAPSCSMSASTSTAPAGTPVRLTWDSTNAQRALWDNGAVGDLAGTKVYMLGSTTHTYILNVFNQYGFDNCYTTVVVPQAGAAATTTRVVATSTVDGFTATPTTGSIPLSVTFTGSVNNNKVCSAQTFSFGFGDGATSTVVVGANVCKAVTFTFTHSYIKVATSTAGLYRSTGTTTAQRIQTQVILAKAKVALGSPSAMLASALSAVGRGFAMWLDALVSFFTRR